MAESRETEYKRDMTCKAYSIHRYTSERLNSKPQQWNELHELFHFSVYIKVMLILHLLSVQQHYVWKTNVHNLIKNFYCKRKGKLFQINWFYPLNTIKQKFFSLVTQRLKRLPAMLETWVRSLSRKDLLEKEMATHSSILAWRIPGT